MGRIALCLLAIVLVISMLSACTPNQAEPSQSEPGTRATSSESEAETDEEELAGNEAAEEQPTAMAAGAEEEPTQEGAPVAEGPKDNIDCIYYEATATSSDSAAYTLEKRWVSVVDLKARIEITTYGEGGYEMVTGSLYDYPAGVWYSYDVNDQRAIEMALDPISAGSERTTMGSFIEREYWDSDMLEGKTYEDIDYDGWRCRHIEQWVESNGDAMEMWISLDYDLVLKWVRTVNFDDGTVVVQTRELGNIRFDAILPEVFALPQGLDITRE